MNNKALYVLAGYDEDTERYLAGIQNELYKQGFAGRQTKNIPQHTTLGSFPMDKESELKEQLQNISKTTASFTIEFNHIGIFHGSEVLFIAPDKCKELIELQEKFGDSLGWTPHTTMLIDNPETIMQAVPIVLDKFRAFEGKVTTLHLYEFWPTRHLLTIHLK